MAVDWIGYGVAVLFIVQGVAMLIWPEQLIRYKVWKYKRFIGAQVDPGGKWSRRLYQVCGGASLLIGTFVLYNILTR